MVEGDAAARARLRAAWTLDGDPVSALHGAADTDPTDLPALASSNARLRRLAFGRTTNAEEEAAAAGARHELELIETRASERRRALDVAITAVLDGAPPEDEPTEPPESSPGPEHPTDKRRGWLVPAVGGALVGAVVAVGVAMSFGAVGTTAAPSTPTPTPTGLNYFLGEPPDSTRGRGDFAAAETWFERAQTEEDLVGVGELRPEFDRDSVRLVHSSESARVWIARQLDGKLCLETTETRTQNTNGTCISAALFSEQGITVSSNVLDAAWNGVQVRVVLAPPRG
jgi:hypothetical protein